MVGELKNKLLEDVSNIIDEALNAVDEVVDDVVVEFTNENVNPVKNVVKQCCYISFSVLSQTKSSLVWKVTPENCVRFSKPIPVWFGKIKTDFARHRFQTKFRLVWEILMTIVNVLKIPNQITFVWKNH